MKNKTLYLVILFILTGLIASSYLTYKAFSGGGVACPIFEGGCDLVLNSEYSKFLGVHLSIYGILFYLGMLSLVSVYIKTKEKLALKLLTIGATVGFILSIIFEGIQGFLIGAFCFWCGVSAVSSILIFLLVMYFIKK